MNRVMLAAFSDELEKIAFVFVPAPEGAAKRLLSDIRGGNPPPRDPGSSDLFYPGKDRGATRRFVHDVKRKVEEHTKTSGVVSDVGNKVVSGAKWLGRHSVEAAKDAGKGAYEVVRHPISGTKRGWDATVHASKQPGFWGKATMPLLAFSTAVGLNDLRKREDPTGQNRAYGERIGDFVGSNVGGLIGAQFGLAGGLSAGIAGQFIGSRAGRVVDRLRGARPAKPQVQQPQQYRPVPAQPQVAPDQLHQAAQQWPNQGAA